MAAKTLMAPVLKQLEDPWLTSSSALLLLHDGSSFNMMYQGQGGDTHICDIFAQFAPPLDQNIWIRSRMQEENVVLTETFAFFIGVT